MISLVFKGNNRLERSSGTALVKDGKPLWVVSAAHCFSEDGTYYLVVVTPDLKQSIWGIEKITRFDGSNDVVIVKVGTPTKIAGIPSPVVGSVQFPGKRPFFLMDYQSTLAESGSGFKHNNETFVISQFVVLTDNDQRTLGLKPRNGFFTLLTSATINWP